MSHVWTRFEQHYGPAGKFVVCCFDDYRDSVIIQSRPNASMG